MRWLPLLLFLPLAGCLAEPDTSTCWQGEQDMVWFLGPGYTLTTSLPEAGSAPGNGFAEAFLTNDMQEWRSAPVDGAFVIDGNVTVEFWAENVGTPAPVIIGGQPGEGYHFFNQFGTLQGFHPNWAVEYAEAIPTPGSQAHYLEEFAPAPGGFLVESGDKLRLLLTSLVTNSADGSGHIIHFGGETPSQVRFTARCVEIPALHHYGVAERALDFPANRGLLTGVVPAGPANEAWFDMQWDGDIDEITIRLRQGLDPNPAKDDVDFTVYDSNGTAVWNGGSPYTNEDALLWDGTIDALFPDGRLSIHVASYSGFAYQGTLEVVVSGAAPHHVPWSLRQR